MPRIDRLPLSAVEPNTYNPNRMKPDQRKALKKMVSKYGFLQPMLVRAVEQEFPGDPNAKYVLVDGEQRYDTLKELNTAEADFVILDDDFDDNDVRLLTLVMNELRGKHIPIKHAELLVDLEAEIGRDSLIEAGFTDGDLEKAQDLAGPIPDDPDPEPLDEPKDLKVRFAPHQWEVFKRGLEAAKTLAETEDEAVALVAMATEFISSYPDADPLLD